MRALSWVIGVVMVVAWARMGVVEAHTRPLADEATVDIEEEEEAEKLEEEGGGIRDGLEGRFRQLRNQLDNVVVGAASSPFHLGYEGCSCADLAALSAQITSFEEEVKGIAVLEKKLTLVATAIKQLGAWVNAGVRGPRGPAGEAGTPGPTGAPGDTGDPGEDTQHSRTGVPGPPGHPGASGTLGPKGEKGDCIKGNKGARGRKGDPGVGPRGRRGSPGPPGQPGEPAQQLEPGV